MDEKSKLVSNKKERRTLGVHLTSVDIFSKYILPDIRETLKDFIWVDLDTYVSYDISYINELNNVFVENGGKTTTPNILIQNPKPI